MNPDTSQACPVTAEQPKQQARKVPNARVKDDRKQTMPKVAMRPPPKLRHKSDQNQIENNKVATRLDEERRSPCVESVTNAGSPSDEEQDESSEDDSSVSGDCEGDESAFAFYSTFDYVSESDDSAFQTETDSESETAAHFNDVSSKWSLPAPSASTIAGVAMVKREDDEERVLHDVSSGGLDIALFPDNPLGPVRWEQGTRAFSYTFPLDESSASDASQYSQDDDVIMEDVKAESVELFPFQVPLCFQRTSDYRLSWNEQQASFAELPELSDEDLDSIARTPESSADSALLADLPYQRDFSITSDREITAEPFLDLKGISDKSLDNVVQMLGELLPPNDIVADAIKDDAAFFHPSYTARIRPGQRAPRFFASRRQDSDIPLGLPLCDIANPLSSPNPVSVESCGSPSSRTPPCDTGPGDASAAMMESHELDFLSSLQNQVSQIDIDSEDLSLCEDHSEIDNQYNIRHVNNTTHIKIKQDDPHLGPESVGMSELDDLLGGSTGVLSPATGSSIASWLPSESKICISSVKMSHRPVLDKDTERQDVIRECGNKEQRNHTHLPPDSECIASQRQGHLTDIAGMMTVEEDDQIGIKEVDDAILYSWVEEGCLTTFDEAEDSSTSTGPSSDSAATTRDSSIGMDFDVKSVSHDDPFEIAPVSVDPSVLSIVRPSNLFSASKLPEVPLLGRSSSERLPTAWNDDPEMPQGLKAVPRFAIRPRAMVKCVPLLKGKSASPPPIAPALRKSKRVESRMSDTEAPVRSSVTPVRTIQPVSAEGAASKHEDVIPREKASMAAIIPATSSKDGIVTPSASQVDLDVPKITPPVDSGPCRPRVTHKPVDNVFVYVISWRNASVLRRIDTNYSK